MASRLRLSDHSDDVSCEQSDCSPPPPPAPVPPSPLPPPSSSPSSHTFITALIITGSALAVLVLCLFPFLLFVRRRRRRREAHLEAALAPAAPDGVGVLDLLADQEAGGEEIVHHAWHIRTVGLDEAAIESIPLTRYRAGASADCAVCLGEFVDGELLRLLPRCAHAFHVRCIDTWLRAHVNCPFCRSHVLDSGPAAQQSDSPEGSDAVDAGQAASSNTTTEHEQPGQQRVVRLQIDQHDGRSPEQPHRHPGPRGQNFRRVASMDLSSLISSASPEPDEQVGTEKQGTGWAVHCESLSPGCSVSPKNHRGMKRSLSVGSRRPLVSRHCRRSSSSLLPL